jgi:hypothetical protein
MARERLLLYHLTRVRGRDPSRSRISGICHVRSCFQRPAEIVVGRGSSIEAYPFFGYSLNDYDALFKEKLDLLLQIRDNEFVTWSGKFRPAIQNLPVKPQSC